MRRMGWTKECGAGCGRGRLFGDLLKTGWVWDGPARRSGSGVPRPEKGDVIWIQRARATSRDLRGRPGPKPEDDPAAHFTSPLTASRSLERGSDGHSVVSSTEPMLGEHDESRPWAIAFCVSTTVDLRPDENLSPREQPIGGCFSFPLGRWALDGAPIYLRCRPADGRRKGGGRGTACARPTPRPRRQLQRFRAD